MLYQLSYTRILDQAAGEPLRQAKRGGKLEEFVGVARDFLDGVERRVEGGYPRKSWHTGLAPELRKKRIFTTDFEDGTAG